MIRTRASNGFLGHLCKGHLNDEIPHFSLVSHVHKPCQVMPPCKIHENISKEKLTMVLTLSLNAFDWSLTHNT